MKRTTTEKRAHAPCESIKPHRTEGASYPLTVEWIDSRTWGSNPRIMHNGEKTTNISGCGYCKHSACLASALSDLGATEDERHSIGRTGGAGVSSVQRALKDAGWILEGVAGGKKFDVYTIRRA